MLSDLIHEANEEDAMGAPQKRVEPLDEEIVVLRGALQTLYDLLEAYGPSWYTDEERQSAEYALRFRT